MKDQQKSGAESFSTNIGTRLKRIKQKDSSSRRTVFLGKPLKPSGTSWELRIGN